MAKTNSDFTNPAPYGQACLECSRAKCKCMRRPAGGTCERCLRRGIECRPPPSSVRQRGAPSAKGLGSRTVRLEEKLDTLVTLLQSQQSSSSSGTTTLPAGRLQPSAGLDTPPGTTPSTDAADESSGSPGNLTRLLAPSVDPSASTSPFTVPVQQVPSPQESASQEDPENVTDAEADECLRRFRSQLRCFPFVYLPEAITPAELRQSRPYLWMAILSVSTRSSSRQAALCRKIQRIIADKLVVQHERSIDLLLAMLAYLGWANYQMGPGQPFLGVQCHLLISLIQDLGIEKTGSKRFDEPNHPMACLKNHLPIHRLASSSTRTMEERRALLAGYLITSEIASFRNYCFNRTLDGLRWTPHLEAALQVLEEEREAPLDPLLATLVRLKVAGDEATKPVWYTVPPTDQSSFQYIMQMRALQARIVQIKQDAPKDAEYEKIISLFTLSTELEISEVGLYTPSHARSPNNNNNNNNKAPKQRTQTAPDVHRLAMLSSAVQAARAWLDIFFTFDNTEYADVGFSIWCRVSHVITSLYRLSLYEEPGWDRALVRETVDVMQVLDTLMERFSCVVASDSRLVACDRTDGGGDPYSNVVRSIRTIRAAWAPLLGHGESGGMGLGGGGVGGWGGNAAGGGGGSGSGEMQGLEGGDVGAAAVDQQQQQQQQVEGEAMDFFSSEFLEGVNGWMTDMFMSWDPIVL